MLTVATFQEKVGLSVSPKSIVSNNMHSNKKYYLHCAHAEPEEKK